MCWLRTSEWLELVQSQVLALRAAGLEGWCYRELQESKPAGDENCLCWQYCALLAEFWLLLGGGGGALLTTACRASWRSLDWAGNRSRRSTPS